MVALLWSVSRTVFNNVSACLATLIGKWSRARKGPLKEDVIMHLIALVVMQRRSSFILNNCWATASALLLIAVVSLVEFPCGRSSSALTDAIVHAVPLVWLVAMALSEDAVSRVLIGAFLATSLKQLALLEAAAYLIVWVACFLVVEETTLRSVSGPVLIFALLVRTGGSTQISSKSVESFEVFTDVKECASQSAPIVPLDHLTLADAVGCFPNWIPPSHLEVRDWRKDFGFPEDALLAVYACGVKSSHLLHRGRLFISNEHIGFFGTAAIMHTLQFVAQLSCIKEFRRGDQRDLATMVFKTPILLRDRQARNGFITDVELHDLEASGVNALLAMLLLLAGARPPMVDTCQIDAISEPTKSPSKIATDAISPAGAPPFQQFLVVNIPRLDIKPLIDDVLSEDWGAGSLFQELYRTQGATEVNLEPWTEQREEQGVMTKIREVNIRALVPPTPFMPKTVKQTQTCSVSACEASAGHGPSFVVERSFVNHGLPYCEYFVVQEKLSITHDEASRGADVTISGRCVFLKRTMMQSTIESGSLAGLSTAGNIMVDILHRRAAPAPPSLPSTPTSTSTPTKCLPGLKRKSTTCVVKVWELQRRTAVWNDDWRAPFLPHDGLKRWRWVDNAYAVHPWTNTQNRDDAALAAEPPIQAPRGWAAAGNWRILTSDEKEPARCGADGWQYAVDIYGSDHYWVANGLALSVRRRLWVRTFVLDEMQTPETCVPLMDTPSVSFAEDSN